MSTNSWLPYSIAGNRKIEARDDNVFGGENLFMVEEPGNRGPTTARNCLTPPRILGDNSGSIP